MASNRPVAMVTGASRGIGRAAALDLAARGYDLVLAARTVREGTGMVAAGSRGGEAVAVPGSLESTAAAAELRGAQTVLVALDLLDRASVNAAGPAALAAFGRVDVLITSAIVQGPGNMDRIADLDLDDAARLVEGDYLATLRLVQALVPPMAERGSGVFVQVTSFAAQHDPRRPVGEGGWGLAYAAAKSAAHRIAGHVHAEFSRRGVRAYNLDPGFVITEAIRARGTTASAGTAGPQEPAVPAAVIGWLTSDDHRAIEMSGRTVASADWWPVLTV